MSSSSLFWITLPALLVSASCVSGEERLCRADEFFCQSDWPSKIDQLSTTKIYELSQKHVYVVRRGSRPLEEAFGKRGEEAFRVLHSSYSEQYFEYYLFASMVLSLNHFSGINGCKDPYYKILYEFLVRFPDKYESDKQDRASNKFVDTCQIYNGQK